MKFLVCITIVACFVTQAFTKNINYLDWVVFVKTYGKEKFVINFPKDPISTSYHIENTAKKGISLKSSEKGIDYHMQIVSKSNKDAQQILAHALEQIKSFSAIRIMDVFLSEDQEKKMLDILFQDRFSSLLCKVHMMVTNYNVYSFFTSYKEGMQEKHDFFVQSFHLLF